MWRTYRVTVTFVRKWIARQGVVPWHQVCESLGLDFLLLNIPYIHEKSTHTTIHQWVSSMNLHSICHLDLDLDTERISARHRCNREFTWKSFLPCSFLPLLILLISTFFSGVLCKYSLFCLPHSLLRHLGKNTCYYYLQAARAHLPLAAHLKTLLFCSGVQGRLLLFIPNAIIPSCNLLCISLQCFLLHPVLAFLHWHQMDVKMTWAVWSLMSRLTTSITNTGEGGLLHCINLHQHWVLSWTQGCKGCLWRWSRQWNNWNWHMKMCQWLGAWEMPWKIMFNSIFSADMQYNSLIV
jgi:hypothetical protein